MKQYFIVLFLFLGICGHAIEIDSVKRREIIREGQNELCNLIEYNSHVTDPAEKKFVVIVDGNEPNNGFVVQKHVDTLSTEILSQVCVDSINAVLGRTYQQYNIEMYMVILKTFNIIVSSPLPSNPTVQGLFNDKLYDAQTNLAVLRAEHLSITNEIINNTFSARNRDCLVYSRAEYSGALVPGKVGSWMFSKRVKFHAASPTYPKLDELTDYFADRTINNPSITQAGLEYALRTVANEFYESAKYTDLRGQILTTLTSTAMSSIFAQFNEQVDYEALNEQERIHALAVFSGYPMHDNMITHEERYACKIMENTPSDQVPLFLNDLSQTSPMFSNPAYYGQKPNEALIVTLIHQVDDGILGDGDNYARMMRALTSIELSNKDFVSTHLPQTNQQWLDRRIYWDDWHVLSIAPIGTHDYDVTLNGDGTLNVGKQVVDRIDWSYQSDPPDTLKIVHWDNTYAPVALNPFDLVVFTNRSSYSMIQVGGAAPDQPFLAPAIFLKYADDKAFNSNSVTTVAVALDVVALITGPGAILGAIEAGNMALCAFEALQFIGSGANLVANASVSPEFQEAVQMFNMVVGAWGLSRIAVTGAKYTTDYITAALDGTIQKVPLATAQQYCREYDEINSWTNADPAVQGKMARMRELLGEQVTAGVVEASSQFSHAVINGLNGFSNDIVGLAAAHDLSLAEFIVLEGKSASDLTVAERVTINDIRNAIPNPSGTTVMQKVLPKADIGKYLDGTYTQVGGFISTCQDTKHLNSYEDLYYGLRLDYNGTNFHLNDGSCGVIRYRSPDITQSRIPRSTLNGGIDDGSMPFTGHGFTSGNNGRMGVPEWKSPYLTPDDGAELWEVFSDGTEVLRGKFSVSQNKFIAVQ